VVYELRHSAILPLGEPWEFPFVPAFGIDAFDPLELPSSQMVD
jgi:hypothetical protein